MNLPEIVARNCKYGRMYIPISDTYIGKALDFYGEYSELEVDLFRNILKPGMWSLDVGANIGAFTLPMAKFVGEEGKVIAFEPQPVIFQILHTTCSVNKLTNTLLVNAAAGDKGGEIAIPDVDYSAQGNFGGVPVGTGTNTVPMITIDGLNLPACHFIKIDVEGAEFDAITGAKKTIEKYNPILYVENDRKEKSHALISLIMGMGYELYWHLPPMYNPDNFSAEEENLWPGMISVNMVCVPAGVVVKGLDRIDSEDDRPACLEGVE